MSETIKEIDESILNCENRVHDLRAEIEEKKQQIEYELGAVVAYKRIKQMLADE